MKTLVNIKKSIENDKSLMKKLNSMQYYNIDSFISDAKSYIKAIKQGRMINSIDSVSASGMSRTIKFLSCEKSKNSEFYYRNYFQFFKSLGYSLKNNNSNYFRIHGCGMDMIFHTNYTNIHVLQRLGFLSKKECSVLAQKTPSTI